jgi:DNA-binding MarR family transcriptional regulator
MTLTNPDLVAKPYMARPPAELVSSTSHLLKRLGWAVKDRGMSAYAEAGMTPYHHAVLAVLDEDTPETQAMIADALGYDRSHLVGILDELEERGLVERRRDPTDRRRHLVTLTADGKRTLSKLRAIAKRVDDKVLAPLDAKQREALHSLLLELMSHHEPRYAQGGRSDGS